MQEMQAAFEGSGYIVKVDGFCGVMADAAGGTQKNHCRGNFFGQDHRVMTGAAYHAVGCAAYLADCLLNLAAEEGIHRDG